MYQRNFNSRSKLFSTKVLLSKVTLIIFCFSLMLSAFTIAASATSPAPQTKIFKAGIILTAGQSAQLGAYQLKMGNDGNLTFKNMETGKALWQSSTSGMTYDYVKINKDGAVKLHKALTSNIFKTIIPPVKNAIDAELYMNNLGKLYVMTKSHLRKSSNFTPTSNYHEISAPKTYQVSTQNIQEILKCGDFKFVLTSKGNLAIRKVNQLNKMLIRIWESGTTGKGVKEFSLGKTGLILKSTTGKIIWSSTPDNMTTIPSYSPSLRLYDSGLLALCGWKSNAIIPNQMLKK